MIKWLKKKIEINNRREKNDKGDDGYNAWSLSSFLILFFFAASLIAFVVFCGIAYNPISFLALMFPVFIIGWQFWHLLFYYGPKYDNKEGEK